MSESRSRWRWPRWVFLSLFVIAISYVAVRTLNFLSEAQMSLGLDRSTVAGIDGLLINQQGFDPPQDSLMRPVQVHVMLRLVEAIDSLERRSAGKRERELRLADLMNEHLWSKAIYTWVRGEVVHTLRHRPNGHRDSVHAQMIHMLRPRFDAVRYIYRDSLDRLLIIDEHIHSR